VGKWHRYATGVATNHQGGSSGYGLIDLNNWISLMIVVFQNKPKKE
jgi:hypothetical protein